MKLYTVRVTVEGVGDYEVECLSKSPESAANRCKFSIAAHYHRQTDLDKITAVTISERERFDGWERE